MITVPVSLRPKHPVYWASEHQRPFHGMQCLAFSSEKPFQGPTPDPSNLRVVADLSYLVVRGQDIEDLAAGFLPSTLGRLNFSHARVPHVYSISLWEGCLELADFATHFLRCLDPLKLHSLQFFLSPQSSLLQFILICSMISLARGWMPSRFVSPKLLRVDRP
jgi:hypothetical protein